MQINKVDNISYKGLYKIPYSERNLKELTEFVVPAYMNISKEPVIIFSGNNPFKIGLSKLMELIAEKNNSSVNWLKMNAQNHGMDVSETESKILNIVTTNNDINKLQEYMLNRINSRKPKFMDKVKNFFGVREVPDFDENLPAHLAVLSEGLKLDKEESAAFAEYSKKAKLLNSAQELFKALMSEH